jgi:ubiquinone/menaquinone biosynthesis C-methylase UbiE
MALSRQPHFVRDYRRVVANYLAVHPLDKAMALAVGGGDYEINGRLECDALVDCGLKPGHSVVDIGCGSGRLSTELTNRFGDQIKYLGLDVVPELLDYARSKAIDTYKFETTEGLVIPASATTIDFVAAFSVFTHLKHRETLAYMREAHRVLRTGGILLFTFLELLRHRRELMYTVAVTLLGRRKVQNHFLSRRGIERWAKAIGFQVEAIGPNPMGQSLAVLRKL